MSSSFDISQPKIKRVPVFNPQNENKFGTSRYENSKISEISTGFKRNVSEMGRQGSSPLFQTSARYFI
jgi:hypothetical protein